MNAINGFRGENYFLSNFYTSPFEIEYDGHRYTMQTGEHGFHAMKIATSAEDPHTFLSKMAEAQTPNIAKRLGRTIRIDVARWNAMSYQCMERVVELKFSQNIDLSDKLVATSPALLVEENNWGDRLWGTVNGEGKNQLGIILMSYRESLLTKQITN